MEEILASIRKIIENNDPPEALDVSHLSSQPRDMRDSIHLTIDDDLASMAANQAVAPAVEPAESLLAPAADKPVQTAGRPMSLADVAARVKAAADRRAPANDTESWSQPAQPAASNTSKPEAAAPTEAALAETETLAAADFELAAYAAVERDEMTEEPETIDAKAAPAVEHEPASEAMPHEDPIERFAAEIGNQIAATVPAQLLSPSVEEKVSRSFEELAEALGGSKRSLEEIAEEMLRPMLQEWLDDNLPTMVERLVREEIERVARGPRR